MLVAAACGDDEEGDTTEAAGQVAGGPVVTFDGEECDCSGPDSFDVGDSVTFTFNNESSEDAGVGIWRLTFLGGFTSEDFVATPGVVLEEGAFVETLVFSQPTSPGSESEMGVAFTQFGDFALACVTNPVPGGFRIGDRAFAGAPLEVKE